MYNNRYERNKNVITFGRNSKRIVIICDSGILTLKILVKVSGGGKKKRENPRGHNYQSDVVEKVDGWGGREPCLPGGMQSRALGGKHNKKLDYSNTLFHHPYHQCQKGHMLFFSFLLFIICLIHSSS